MDTSKAADVLCRASAGRALANVLELAKRAVDLQALAEVPGGLRVKIVIAEAANESEWTRS